MKFYTSHQIALHTAIADHGFTKDAFSFTKKKGRIIANHNSTDATFAFIERRESTLDVQKMRVLDKFSYELVVNSHNSQVVESWNELLTKFIEWLTNLKG